MDNAGKDAVAPERERRQSGRVSRRLTLGVALLTALTLGMAGLAADGLRQLRHAAGAASADPVATLSPAMRMAQAADHLAADGQRLLEADSSSVRLATRSAAERRQAAVADYLRHFPAAAASPSGRQIAASLTRLGETLAQADRLAEQRVDAAAALPAARERLVVLIASLGAALAERRLSLTALARFHPDTQTELERHEEWSRLSKNLLGALLLTTHRAADGGSGAVGVAAAHLARLAQVAAGFPDSEFAVALRRRQEEIGQAVNGPDGVLTGLAALRQADDAAASLGVDVQRAAMDLTQAATDHLDALRNDLDGRLLEMAADSAARELRIAALALVALLAALAVTMYARRVGRRLKRLRADLSAGAAADVQVSGGDDVALLAEAARAMIEDVQRQTADLKESRIRFDLAVEATDAAIWDEDLTEGKVWWSLGYYRLLGYAPDEISPQVGAWEMLVHPDDRAAAAEAAERCLAGVADTYNATYRVRRKDGVWVWVEDFGRIQRDHDGLPLRFVGLMLDISRRRSAEIRLRQAKERAEAAARSGGALLAAADHRLRPGLRRLNVKLTQLEGWALTDEQRREIAGVRQESQQVLEALAELSQAEAARVAAPPSGPAPTTAADEHDDGETVAADRAAIRRLPDLDEKRLMAAFAGEAFPRNALTHLRANIRPLLDRMARELAVGDQDKAQAAARDAETAADSAGLLALAEACRRFAAAMAVNRRHAAADLLEAARAAVERVALHLGDGEE